MSPPRFKRPSSAPPKEWTNADLDALQVRVDNCENFCEAANDYMHDDDDAEDTPEEKVMKELFADMAKDEMKARLKKKDK